MLTLEQAVRKATALAADHVGIEDRGRLVPGAFADLVLFDPATVADRATTDEPHALATGIERVWVNGAVVYEGGRTTGARPGRVVRRTTAMTETALVLTAGILGESNAKTAHGLLRGPSRFRLLGVVDDRHAGRDAGEVVDGRVRRIPCFATLDAALAALPEPPDWLIVGVAFHGGRMPEAMRGTVLEGVRRGIGAVNGLHQLLADDPEIAAAAAASGARLHDIRRTPKFAELRFWTGEALALAVPRVAVLGTDCALGKRTTATFLLDGLRRRGLTAELVTTGQTGWLQGHRYGFILDATPNDFVTGELERAVVACAREAHPDLILLEGQSALRNPSGPCGAELLLAAGASGRRPAARPGARVLRRLRGARASASRRSRTRSS